MVVVDACSVVGGGVSCSICSCSICSCSICSCSTI